MDQHCLTSLMLTVAVISGTPMFDSAARKILEEKTELNLMHKLDQDNSKNTSLVKV